MPRPAAGAPRRLSRPWRRLARGAGLALALVAGPAAAAEVITAARYAEPTTRYDHGILGDAVEWGALVLETADQGDTGLAPGTAARRILRLPETRVFEDTAPRVADLDGDGLPEVIVVESDLARGARLAVYGPMGLIAATPFIGQPHRWLAPLGAADLDGDGAIEIAYVDRPHLAKILRIWRFEAGALTEIASAQGFTNHRIGWDYIEGGIRDCGQGPEMVLASGDWSRVMAVRFDGTLSARALGPYSPQTIAAALNCR